VIRLFDFDKVPTSDILTRGILAEENVDAAVDAVLAAVRAEGDAALRSYEKQFDGAELDGLFVTEAELDAAEAQVDPELLETLHQAAENIRAFHSRQTHNDFVLTDKPGVVMGQRYTPIESVGVCVPGTPVAFPSTVLMDVIPAKLAGVREILMATPPLRTGPSPRRLWRRPGSRESRKF
jgi:Histidinol dehydrogenase